MRLRLTRRTAMRRPANGPGTTQAGATSERAGAPGVSAPRRSCCGPTGGTTRRATSPRGRLGRRAAPGAGDRAERTARLSEGTQHPPGARRDRLCRRVQNPARSRQAPPGSSAGREERPRRDPVAPCARAAGGRWRSSLASGSRRRPRLIRRSASNGPSLSATHASGFPRVLSVECPGPSAARTRAASAAERVVLPRAGRFSCDIGCLCSLRHSSAPPSPSPGPQVSRLRAAQAVAAPLAPYTETIPDTQVTFDMVPVPAGTF